MYDSRRVGQPEILEKTRACEAYSAEVWQLTVGPELFYIMLQVLEETRFFSASLYVPTSILGIETLGYELAHQVAGEDHELTEADKRFLAKDSKSTVDQVREAIRSSNH